MNIVGITACADTCGVVGKRADLFPVEFCGAGEYSRLEHTRTTIVFWECREAPVSHPNGGQRGRVAGTEHIAIHRAAVEHRGYRVNHLAKAATPVEVFIDGASL